jgi:hypothetical protein
MQARFWRAQRLDGDDADLWDSAPFFGKILHIDEALGVYRTHGGNVSMTSGRTTVRNLGARAYYQFVTNSGPSKMPSVSPTRKGARRNHLVGAYPSMWLLAKDGGYYRLPLPDQGQLLTIAVAIKAFFQTPGIEPSLRLKNIGLMALLAILPLLLRCRIADRRFFRSERSDGVA